MQKPDSYYESLDKRSKEYKDWKKSKEGLGDKVEKVTKKTGIKKAVDWFSKKTGIDCGCEDRKDKLNQLFRSNPKCLTLEQYKRIVSIGEKLTPDDREEVARLHAEIFNHKYYQPCTCSPKRWRAMVNDLIKVKSTYEVI